MASITLSRRDVNVLEKIKDPEFNPLSLAVDATLPKDPHIDTTVYDRVSQREKDIIISMQQLEMQLAGLKAETIPDPIQEYRDCVHSLGQLIAEYPTYASARNNRAQALRRLYGDAMLLAKSDPRALIQDANDKEKMAAVVMTLSDLDEAITLLTPRSLFASISPQAGKTLSLAHTQRAAIYYMTAKSLAADGQLALDEARKESKWARLEFEEAASRDFAFGGRYGNDIARGLAVSANPTAKLCGAMVREAMKKEYGPSFEF